jgi:Holliday junction resolvasome RuvABC ATP-dependent DNA helicase subunit
MEQKHVVRAKMARLAIKKLNFDKPGDRKKLEGLARQYNNTDVGNVKISRALSRISDALCSGQISLAKRLQDKL